MRPSHIVFAAGIVLGMLAGTGCSTNELERYQLSGAPMLYTSFVRSDAARVRVNISSPTPEKPSVVDVIAGIGSEIATAEAQRKLDNAVRPEGIALAVGDGIDRVIATAIGTARVKARTENPSFIVETVLEECDIVSGEGGLALHLRACCNVLDAADGKLIWEDCESRSAALRRTPGGHVPVPGIGTAVSVWNAAEFFRLSDAEIQDAILSAARDVGERIGRELREDYAESRK